MLSPCLFNLYVEYIMRNAGLEEAQAGIQIAGRNINHLTYADGTTLMAESEGELMTLFFFIHLNRKFIIFIFQVFSFSIRGQKRNLKDICHLLPN